MISNFKTCIKLLLFRLLLILVAFVCFTVPYKGHKFRDYQCFKRLYLRAIKLFSDLMLQFEFIGGGFYYLWVY